MCIYAIYFQIGFKSEIFHVAHTMRRHEKILLANVGIVSQCIRTHRIMYDTTTPIRFMEIHDPDTLITTAVLPGERVHVRSLS